MIVGIIVAAVVLVALLVLAKAVRIAREYQRLVLFRLGRAVGTRGPGIIFLNPVTDRTVLVDLREQYLEVPHQTAITKDNAPISIDFIIFYKVVDPSLSVLAVGNFAGAALNVAATTLRSVVGDMPLDDVLSKREAMNALLRVRLDEVTERWGVKVTNVEVREVNPPPSVQEAMTRQMSAERTRRAQVTEAEGSKAAAILAAEGQKQSAVLSAEGQKQAAVLAADGERQAALLRAQGYASALNAIFGVARTLDENTLALQYLDTLRQIGTSPSTKFVVPMEVGSIVAGVRGLLASQAGSPAPHPAPSLDGPGGDGAPGAASPAAAEIEAEIEATRTAAAADPGLPEELLGAVMDGPADHAGDTASTLAPSSPAPAGAGSTTTTNGSDSQP
ncbi:MAG TPA: SPFH domain-containing protein [Acidimicrobiales bacterium]|nr:SPFH domain-containing protein [Acidimicrobiales bacterium]